MTSKAVYICDVCGLETVPVRAVRVYVTQDKFYLLTIVNADYCAKCLVKSFFNTQSDIAFLDENGMVMEADND